MVENSRITYPSPIPKRRRTSYVPPGLALVGRLGSKERPRFSIWVEAQGLPEQQDGDLVKIAWAFGSARGDVADIRERTVCDVEIKRAIMEDFMSDVIEVVVRQGGRLWGHNVGIHGGVIAHQLRHLGMQALHRLWEDVMDESVCLNCELIGSYVKQSCNEGCLSEALPLQGLVCRLLPEYARSCREDSAAIEKVATILHLAHALFDLMLPPCRKVGCHHTYTRIYPSYVRDNGEWLEQCSVCLHTRP